METKAEMNLKEKVKTCLKNKEGQLIIDDLPCCNLLPVIKNTKKMLDSKKECKSFAHELIIQKNGEKYCFCNY